MWSPKQRLAALAGGTIAAAALFGGAALAQTAGGTTTPPAPGGPSATQPAPDDQAPSTKRDCPDKSGSQGTQGSGTSSAPRF